MRRNKALRRSRAFPVLAAGTIGYLIGGWHPALLGATTDLNAADSVALRFPQQWDAASPAANAATTSPASAPEASPTPVARDDAEFALLDPEPMVPQAIPRAAAQAVAPVTGVSLSDPNSQPAAAEDADAPHPLAPSETPPPPAALHPARLIRASTPAVQHRAINRPGYVLDDAQIASIKERLHLTPDQQRMWPAVEAALRNIAYKRGEEARRRDGRPTQVAFDPQAVEGLKSAAVPLIMSFNDEQKQEVRDVAHVMGLDQLASQF